MAATLGGNRCASGADFILDLAPKSGVTAYAQGDFVIFDSGANFSVDLCVIDEKPDGYVINVQKNAAGTITNLAVRILGYTQQVDAVYTGSLAIGNDILVDTSDYHVVKTGGGSGVGKVIAVAHITGRCVFLI